MVIADRGRFVEQMVICAAPGVLSLAMNNRPAGTS